MAKLTVKDLKELLEPLDDSMQILLARDPEGNGFQHWTEGGYSFAVIDPSEKDSYVIDSVYDDAWTADDAGMDEDEWNELLEQDRVLVLWP